MSDLIDRQDAIDAINVKNVNKGIISALQSIIEELPSAQPEIIKCKDCKWFNDVGCAIEIVDDTDKPSENDYCSFAERRTDEQKKRCEDCKHGYIASIDSDEVVACMKKKAYMAR